MSRPRDLAVALAVAVAAGGVTALGWTVATTDRPDRDLDAASERVRQAVEDLRSGDHVHVAPDAHDRLPPDAEDRLETLAADSSLPVWVVVWEGSYEDGTDGPYDTLDEVERLLGEDGVYVVYEGPGEGAVDARIDGGRVSVDTPVPDDLLGDPVLRLTEIVEAADRADVEPSSLDDYWGGRSGAFWAGVLFGLLALPVVLLLVGLARLVLGRPFRMRGGWR